VLCHQSNQQPQIKDTNILNFLLAKQNNTLKTSVSSVPCHRIAKALLRSLLRARLRIPGEAAIEGKYVEL
jgi:hypothetical protein